MGSVKRSDQSSNQLSENPQGDRWLLHPVSEEAGSPPFLPLHPAASLCSLRTQGCGGAHVQTSSSTPGHLGSVHFHFREPNPGALERSAQEKRPRAAQCPPASDPGVRVRAPQAAPAPGKPRANLLPLSVEDAGVPAAAPGASRRGPAGPPAEGQIVPRPLRTPLRDRARPARAARPRPRAAGSGRPLDPRLLPLGPWRPYEAPRGGKVIGFRAPRGRGRRRAAAAACGAWAEEGEAGEGGLQASPPPPRPSGLARAGRGRAGRRRGEGPARWAPGPEADAARSFPAAAPSGAHTWPTPPALSHVCESSGLSPQGFSRSSDAELSWKRNLSKSRCPWRFLSFTKSHGEHSREVPRLGDRSPLSSLSPEIYHKWKP